MLERGPADLSDAELVAAILGTGAGGRSATVIASELLEQYGGPAGLLRAPVARLAREPGLGTARACAVGASLELGRRAASTVLPRGEQVRGGREAFSLVSPRLRHLDHEEFLVLLLDAKNRVQRQVRVAVGGATSCSLHPREVFRPAVSELSPGVIVAHNHPSGDPRPSAEDHALTRRLRGAARELGIALLDHVVVGDGTFFSFAEEGYW
jgi:DNA repair protein RadC